MTQLITSRHLNALDSLLKHVSEGKGMLMTDPLVEEMVALLRETVKAREEGA